MPRKKGISPLEKITPEQAKELYTEPVKRQNKHVDYVSNGESYTCTASEYLFCVDVGSLGLSLKKAYIANFPGCKERYASSYGSELLKEKPWLRLLIDDLRKIRFENSIFTKEDLIGGVMDIFQGNVKDRFDMEVSAADKLQAGKQLADLMGANAPTKQDIKSEVTNKAKVTIVLPDDGTLLD